jgi:hypothetical protein
VASITISTPSSPQTERCRLRLVEDRDLLAVDFDEVSASDHASGKAPVDGVVLQEMCQGFGIGQVVDAEPPEFEAALMSSAKRGPSDSSKSVDSDPGFHGSLLDVDRLVAACRRLLPMRRHAERDNER